MKTEEPATHLPVEYYRPNQFVRAKTGEGYIDFIKKIHHNPGRLFDEIGFRDHVDGEQYHAYPVASIKPILRRLTSMTKEEKDSYERLKDFKFHLFWENALSIDWIDANGFDRPRLIDGVRYDSLIDAGLAIDAETIK